MRKPLTAYIDEAIRAAGVPIDSISIGDYTNRATWTVRPVSLQAQAQPIIDAYADPTPAQLLDEDAQRDVNERKLQAVALALWEAIPNPTMTKAQLKARAIALYKTL